MARVSSVINFLSISWRLAANNSQQLSKPWNDWHLKFKDFLERLEVLWKQASLGNFQTFVYTAVLALSLSGLLITGALVKTRFGRTEIVCETSLGHIYTPDISNLGHLTLVTQTALRGPLLSHNSQVINPQSAGCLHRQHGAYFFPLIWKFLLSFLKIK